jgi:Zinc dependent phospholipase C
MDELQWNTPQVNSQKLQWLAKDVLKKPSSHFGLPHLWPFLFPLSTHQLVRDWNTCAGAVRYDCLLHNAAPRLFLVACLLCSLPQASTAYSVFSHEELIDLTWKDLLQPLLLKKFPRMTVADLEEAQAYAYGGCTIQDLGYYPFSNEFFSDLTHYVRSGDFINNLLRDARNANEYAFALGALSHYVGDNVGHHDAINPATATAFPKLERKYGPSVTYDQNPHAHVRTEFAFDIDQLSKNRLAPGAYLRFIGLEVSYRLLARAFAETYSIPLRDVLGPLRPAIRSYRSSVRSFLPRFAYAEVVLHRNDFPADLANDSFQAFLDHIARADFQTVWNRYRHKPGVRTHLLAVLIRFLPRIGPLSDLAIRIPTPDTQDLYVKSMNHSIEVYGGLLKQLAATSHLAYAIPNRDLDTGDKSQPGTYALTDKTYARLLHKITTYPQRSIAPGLKQDILEYYSDLNTPIATKKNSKAWAHVVKDLAVLQNMPGAAAASN